MNQFGVTRQDVGGENYRYEPPPRRRRRWFDIIPFGPCGIPRQMVAFPFDTRPDYLAQFSRCQDGILQDPTQGLLHDLVLPVLPPPTPPSPSAGVVNTPALQLRKRWITWGLGTNMGTRSTVPLGYFIAPFMIRQITYGSDDAGGFPMQFNFEIGKATGPITEATVPVATPRPYTPILPELVQQSSFSSLPPGTVVGWPLFQSNNRPGYTSFYPKIIIYESTYLSFSYANYGGVATNAAGMVEIVDSCTLEDLRALMV